jgi:pyridoxine/pyridoxamine 5'-phosphate oxidase
LDRNALHRFIAQQRYGVVSSVAEDGTPQSALVGIATTPRLDIVFDTLNNTRKYANLTQRRVCSFVIGWSGEKTLQLEGVAEEVRGEVRNELLDIYFRVWPECRDHLSWPGIAYFIVRPRWIRFSDYGQTPAMIEEFGAELLSSP